MAPLTRDHLPLRRSLLAAALCCLITPFGVAHAAGTAMSPEVASILPANLKGVLHDALPKDLQSKETFVMATDGTLGKPIAWVENSTIKGVSIDIAQALGYVLGVKVEVTNTPFDGLIPSLQAGRAQFSVADMLDTKKREAVVDFVDYLVDGSSILVAADSKLHDLTLEKMCGLTVGSIRGSVEEGYLEKQAAKCKSEGKPALTVNVYQGNDQMLLAVVSGRTQAMMGASAQLAYIAQVSHGKAKQGGEPVGLAVDGIVVSKDSSLTKPMQLALQKLMDSGVYAKIFALYGLEGSMLPKATVNQARY